MLIRKKMLTPELFSSEMYVNSIHFSLMSKWIPAFPTLSYYVEYKFDS
jgi:hypothetical protein